jgi:ketosteroid isomerase-like protein
MTPEENRHVVEQFWAAMNTNDFRGAGAWLHDDYVLDWPQSKERIRGRANFAAINEHYPAAGPWRFVVERLIADEHGVASDVAVTGGAISARVVTFSEMVEGKIVHQTEYWPDPFPAAEWRAQWAQVVE